MSPLFDILISPRLNPKTGLLEPSVFQFKEKSLHPLGRLILNIYKVLGVVRVESVDEEISQGTNCTLINLALKWTGPTHEEKLTSRLLFFQVTQLVLFLGFICSSYPTFRYCAPV